MLKHLLPPQGVVLSSLFLCLSVVCLCLLATLRRKNFWTDLHERFGKDWQWATEQMFKFLVAIQITVWIQGLFFGFVTIGRYGKRYLPNRVIGLVCQRQLPEAMLYTVCWPRTRAYDWQEGASKLVQMTWWRHGAWCTKTQNTTFQCRAPIIKHFMQIEQSHPIFAHHQTFWEPHLPPLRQNCLITVCYLRQCFRCCLSQLSVWLLATLYKNFQRDLHETLSKGWQWANEQVFKFWWQSGSQSGHRDCFPDSSLLGDMERG